MLDSTELSAFRTVMSMQRTLFSAWAVVLVLNRENRPWAAKAVALTQLVNCAAALLQMSRAKTTPAASAIILGGAGAGAVMGWLYLWG